MKSSEAYAQLSLPPSANHDQIRRAYKRACLQWHPDKHPPGPSRELAETKFKAIVLAYSRLSELQTANQQVKDKQDPFADASYRKRFAEGFAKQFAAEGYNVDTESLFDSLFGEKRRVFEFDLAREVCRLEDRVVELLLTLEELVTGCVKKRRIRNEGKEPVVLNIHVRPGYRAGDRVRFRDAVVEGDAEGDVVFVIAVRTHDKFQIKADDVKTKIKVNLVDALAGVVLCVRGLDGKDVKVRVDNVVYPGYVHVIEGKGLPRRNFPEERGEMHLEFHVEFPKRIQADDRGAVRELFAKLERHATNTINMRRSSSLFMSRGGGGINILQGRRNSTTAYATANDAWGQEKEDAPREKGLKNPEEGKEKKKEEKEKEELTVEEDGNRPFGKGKVKLSFRKIFR